MHFSWNSNFYTFVCTIFRSEWINPDWVELNKSRGYESYEHKLFMRYSGKFNKIFVECLAVIS